MRKCENAWSTEDSFLKIFWKILKKCFLVAVYQLYQTLLQFLQTFPKLLVTLIMHIIIICYDVYIALYIWNHSKHASLLSCTLWHSVHLNFFRQHLVLCDSTILILYIVLKYCDFSKYKLCNWLQLDMIRTFCYQLIN